MQVQVRTLQKLTTELGTRCRSVTSARSSTGKQRSGESEQTVLQTYRSWYHLLFSLGTSTFSWRWWEESLLIELLQDRGGVQLARSMLQRSSDSDNYQPPQGTPEWCECGRCRQMDNPIEQVRMLQNTAMCHNNRCFPWYMLELKCVVCVHPWPQRFVWRRWWFYTC